MEGFDVDGDTGFGKKFNEALLGFLKFAEIFVGNADVAAIEAHITEAAGAIHPHAL